MGKEEYVVRAYFVLRIPTLVKFLSPSALRNTHYAIRTNQLLRKENCRVCTNQPPNRRRLRQGFKSFNKFMLLMWRLGIGDWYRPMGRKAGGRLWSSPIKGEKVGPPPRTPVNFALVDGEVYCIAGFQKGAACTKTSSRHTKVEIWLPDSWWTGTAEDVCGVENPTRSCGPSSTPAGLPGLWLV